MFQGDEAAERFIIALDLVKFRDISAAGGSDLSGGALITTERSHPKKLHRVSAVIRERWRNYDNAERRTFLRREAQFKFRQELEKI